MLHDVQPRTWIDTIDESADTVPVRPGDLITIPRAWRPAPLCDLAPAARGHTVTTIAIRAALGAFDSLWFWFSLGAALVFAFAALVGAR